MTITLIRVMYSASIEIVRLLSKIKINPLFWVVIGIGVATGYFREMLIVFTIVFIHELGHAAAANHFQWTIKKIELLPFGGVAEVEYIDGKPFYEEWIVILFGPLQHLWLIALSYLFLSFPFWSESDHRLFVWHNVVLFTFNLLPVLPLDGGRFVQLFFCQRYPYVQALRYTRIVSFATLTVVLCASLFIFPFHLHLFIVLLFLLTVNYMEWKQRHYRFIRFLVARFSGKSDQSRRSTIALHADTPLREAVKRLRRGYVHLFKVYEGKTGTYFFVAEKELLTLYLTRRHPNAPLRSFFPQRPPPPPHP